MTFQFTPVTHMVYLEIQLHYLDFAIEKLTSSNWISKYTMCVTGVNWKVKFLSACSRLFISFESSSNFLILSWYLSLVYSFYFSPLLSRIGDHKLVSNLSAPPDSQQYESFLMTQVYNTVAIQNLCFRQKYTWKFWRLKNYKLDSNNKFIFCKCLPKKIQIFVIFLNLFLFK